MLKITCGPAKHYKILKSGAIRYQKSDVTDPLWRLAVETNDKKLFGRFFSERPTLDALWMSMEYIIESTPSGEKQEALMSSSLEESLPGFAERLQQSGFDVYVPQSSSGGLAPVARRWDKFSDLLMWDMENLSETDLTIEEYEALARNRAGIVGPVAREQDYKAAHELAERLCHLRGREPSEGAKRKRSVGFHAPANTGLAIAKSHDGLAELIERYSPDNVPAGYVLTLESQRIYDIAKCLESICRKPEGSEAAISGKSRLAKILQNLMLVEATSQLQSRFPWGYYGHFSRISMTMVEWLGFESKEMLAFKEGFADAYRLPSIIDGKTNVFFRLPVHWQFDNGLEKTRTMRYLPWREILEQNLEKSLPSGCQIVLQEDLRKLPSTGEESLYFCSSLVAVARFGYRVGEEKGKRASAAIPKGTNKGEGETTLIGLVQYPTIIATPHKWDSFVEQALAEAAGIINQKLSQTLDSLTLKFGYPLPMG